MEQRVVTMVRDGVVAAGISFILFKLTSTATFFIVPLLFAAPRLQESKRALLPVLAVLLLLVGDSLWRSKGLAGEPALAGSLAVGMFFPVSLLVGAAWWIGLPKRGMLVRFLAGSACAAIGGMALVLWFRSGSQTARDTAAALKELYTTLVPALLGTSMPLGVDGELLFDLLATVAELAFLPLFMAQFGFSLLASELLIHRNDAGYRTRMCRWKLPVNTVWVFLVAWTLVLASMVFEVPLLACLAWNSALAVTLLYLVQGMSIVAFIVHKKHERASVVRIFILLSLLVLIPGLNAIALVVLSLFGVSETWVGYRVNE
jgi:hypothetical protein